MKKILIIALLLSGCGAKEKASESLMESAIEKSTGQKVDMDNIMENSQNQSASGVFSFDNKKILDEKTNFSGSVTILKNNEGIAIGAAYGSEDGKQLMLNVTGLKEGFTLPIVAQFGNKVTEGPKAIFTVMSLENNSNAMFETPMPFEGTMTISTLSEKEITYEISAKGANAGQAENPSGWKPMTGKFTLKSPVVIASGIEKNQVLK
jgi:hypothetical protein